MADSNKYKIDLKWIKALETEISDQNTPPSEWKTCRQIAVETGKSYSFTSFLLRTALLKGDVEMKKFKVDTGVKFYPVPHYKIK
jgi:hypothetical protein